MLPLSHCHLSTTSRRSAFCRRHALPNTDVLAQAAAESGCVWRTVLAVHRRSALSGPDPPQLGRNDRLPYENGYMAMTPTGCVPARSSRWPRMRGRRWDLPSQSTMCRLKNLPGVGNWFPWVVRWSTLLRLRPPCAEVDRTAVHGGQQLRLVQCLYDEYGFQPIMMLDGDGRFGSAILRPAKHPRGKSAPHLRRLVRAIRASWPKTRILIRADSHYCSPQIICWRRAKDGRY